MATKDEVNGFLAQFHTKAKVFGITYFGGREKNMNTLAELGITAKFRNDIVRQLSTEDFYKGPEPAVCITFHIAERPITYPFKEQNV